MSEYKKLGLTEVRHGFGWAMKGFTGTMPLGCVLDNLNEEFDELKKQLTEKDKTIEKLRDCVSYIRASHICICGGEELLQCSLCFCDMALKELDSNKDKNK